MLCQCASFQQRLCDKLVHAINTMNDIVIDLKRDKFPIDYVPRKLNMFDFVFGIDSLGSDQAEILSMKKMIRINKPIIDPFVVYKNKLQVDSIIFSMFKDIKCLAKGCRY